MTRHIRNPIKWHGDAPRDHFTMIPNELARDTELSLYAYRIAIVIRTHAEDYEVSAASLAKMWGWHRDTVGKASGFPGPSCPRCGAKPRQQPTAIAVREMCVRYPR